MTVQVSIWNAIKIFTVTLCVHPVLICASFPYLIPYKLNYTKLFWYFLDITLQTSKLPAQCYFLVDISYPKCHKSSQSSSLFSSFSLTRFSWCNWILIIVLCFQCYIFDSLYRDISPENNSFTLIQSNSLVQFQLKVSQILIASTRILFSKTTSMKERRKIKSLARLFGIVDSTWHMLVMTMFSSRLVNSGFLTTDIQISICQYKLLILQMQTIFF